MNHTFSAASFLLVGCLFSGTASCGEDWPEFRGPTGQGVASVQNLPVNWNDSVNVKWKVVVPGKGWSSPIVSNDVIYMTTAIPLSSKSETDQVLCLIAMDKDRGTLIWKTEVFRQSGVETDPIHLKNSHASPTPILKEDRIYVHFGVSGTACLDLDGKVIWRNQSLTFTPVHGNGGSPVLVGDNLIFNCDGANRQFVAALDHRTGKVRWTKDRPPSSGRRFSFSTPLAIEVEGRSQVISAGANAVVSYDPIDGTELWYVTYDGFSVVPRPVFAHGLVYICTGYATPWLLAVRPDGSGDVTSTHIAWRTRTGVPHNPSLLIVEDELYFVSDRGIASCLDARTGQSHWRQRLGGEFSASPVYGDNKVYFQSEDGEGVVLQAGTDFSLLARNPLSEETLASYAVSQNSLFIRSMNHLYCIQSR